MDHLLIGGGRWQEATLGSVITLAFSARSARQDRGVRTYFLCFLVLADGRQHSDRPAGSGLASFSRLHATSKFFSFILPQYTKVLWEI